MLVALKPIEINVKELLDTSKMLTYTYVQKNNKITVHARICSLKL